MDFKTDTYPTPKYTDEQAARIMACLDDLVKTVKHNRCASCNKELYFDYASIYDHDGGWGLIGDVPKQWISFECSCGYHTSLDKLGVPR